MNLTEGAVRELETPDIEYRYIVHVKAIEAFGNRMRREGTIIPEGPAHVSFSTNKRLDMKELREDGLIWSYSIIRVTRAEDILEEG